MSITTKQSQPNLPPPPPSSAPVQAQAPAQAQAAAQTQAQAQATAGGYRMPGNNTLTNAAKFAIVDDKPILLDYWTFSIDKKAIIGVKENGEKLLVKSEDEYTSPISKMFKVGDEYIIVTENSIYLVDKNIPSKRISS